MATANLYICQDDNRKVDKTLKQIKNVTIKYLDDTEYIHPKIRIVFDGSWNMRDINYIYLSDKNRYYFVKNSKILANKIIEYDLEVDVLTSHKAGLRNLTCTVKRNEFVSNGYLNDLNYNVYAYTQIVNKNFPRGFTNNSIILMTVG